MAKYEITFITEGEGNSKNVEGLFETSGVKIAANRELGVRTLTYPIGKQTLGRYFIFQFETEPAKVRELEKLLKLKGNLLRFLLTKPVHQAEPRPVRAPRPPKATPSPAPVKAKIPEVAPKAPAKPDSAPQTKTAPRAKQAAPKLKPAAVPAPSKAAPAARAKKSAKSEVSKSTLEEKLKELTGE